ncbi:methyltransferase [Colletotrichum orchidophilum]|uniref:Methyltransferase n=1 Tax=Colletotrichum orchidophilum TaxID=1209926 RepID=A0A1G4B1D4_9PEZI|nr:methyltransferase [Colletotrichum orchidophilum]OHE95153.1 methyltransferase [Colletotrichum orchidophilum]
MANTSEAQPGSPSVATSPPAAAAETSTAALPNGPQGSLPVNPPASASVETSDALEAEDPATVCDRETDDGASIDDQISSYTASLASSAVDYPTEFGRRYHAFRPGAYFLPNDDKEMARLDMSHNLTLEMLGHRLYLAPLEKENVHKILDIGTGTGIWAMEMGDLFPNAEVYGNDLSPIQPEWVPPNVKFEIDDVESEWIGDRKYDFIFCRYMIGSIADYPKLIKNVYDNLNPGGWAEFTDMSGKYYSADGTLKEEHATFKWNSMLMDTLASTGRDCRPGPQLEGWVREAANFENVTHKKFILPIGPWPKDPHYRELGLGNLAQILEGLDGFSMRVICGLLGWTKVEAEVLLAEVRKELKTVHKFHAQFDIHSVVAQKPVEETA